MSLYKKHNLLYFSFLNCKVAVLSTLQRNSQDETNTVFALKQQKYLTGTIKAFILMLTVFILINNIVHLFLYFHGIMNFKMYEFAFKTVVNTVLNPLCIWEANLTELTSYVFFFLLRQNWSSYGIIWKQS